jgi:hypothetical protein
VDTAARTGWKPAPARPYCSTIEEKSTMVYRVVALGQVPQVRMKVQDPDAAVRDVLAGSKVAYARIRRAAAGCFIARVSGAGSRYRRGALPPAM